MLKLVTYLNTQVNKKNSRLLINIHIGMIKTNMFKYNYDYIR
jgi:hypothetical protein